MPSLIVIDLQSSLYTEKTVVQHSKGNVDRTQQQQQQEQQRHEIIFWERLVSFWLWTFRFDDDDDDDETRAP